MTTFDEAISEFRPLTEMDECLDGNGKKMHRWFGKDNITIELYHDNYLDIYDTEYNTLFGDYVEATK